MADGTVVGIASSRRPEQPGCSLAADDSEVSWFVQMNNTGGPVDVWKVSGIDVDDLVCSPEGHFYFPALVPLQQLRLVQRDLPG